MAFAQLDVLCHVTAISAEHASNGSYRRLVFALAAQDTRLHAPFCNATPVGASRARPLAPQGRRHKIRVGEVVPNPLGTEANPAVSEEHRVHGQWR
jgi:hypothetical protein